MPAAPSSRPYLLLSQRWHALALRRRAFFIELYRSSRWTLYYDKDDFARLMRDVLRAETIWRDLAAIPHGEKNERRDAA